MGFFKKRRTPTVTDFKCPVTGCPFTCTDPVTLKKHTEWKHPELLKTAGEK